MRLKLLVGGSTLQVKIHFLLETNFLWGFGGQKLDNLKATLEFSEDLKFTPIFDKLY